MSTNLELIGASRVYRNGRGLHKTDFSAGPGEIIGLLGANGSGKTTLLKIASGLMRPDSGRALIEGEDVYENPERALKHVGALIENPALYMGFSVQNNLEIVSAYSGIRDKKAVERALELTGLKKYRKEKAAGLSLGLKQRLALAMAFLGEKKLLLLDEPTNGLDIESAAKVKEIIRSAAKETGAAVVVSSHMSADLERLASRIVILSEGNTVIDVPIGEALSGGRTLEEYYISVGKGEEA